MCVQCRILLRNVSIKKWDTEKILEKRYFKKRVSEAGIAFLKKRVYFRNRPENVKACTFWGQTSQIYVSPRRNRQKHATNTTTHTQMHPNALETDRLRNVYECLRHTQTFLKQRIG